MERRRATRPQRVLLVDDSAELREMWKWWLTYWGFTVEEAQNGAEAVQKARSSPPHLILMDYAMPVLDGRAAIGLLASDPTTARVPVIAMSAQTHGRPDWFIPKPSEPDQLIERIRATLHASA